MLVYFQWHRLTLMPRFSLELWIYVKDYCPLYQLNVANACLLVGHLTANQRHQTPIILVDVHGSVSLFIYTVVNLCLCIP